MLLLGTGTKNQNNGSSVRAILTLGFSSISNSNPKPSNQSGGFLHPIEDLSHFLKVCLIFKTSAPSNTNFGTPQGNPRQGRKSVGFWGGSSDSKKSEKEPAPIDTTPDEKRELSVAGFRVSCISALRLRLKFTGQLTHRLTLERESDSVMNNAVKNGIREGGILDLWMPLWDWNLGDK